MEGSMFFKYGKRGAQLHISAEPIGFNFFHTANMCIGPTTYSSALVPRQVLTWVWHQLHQESPDMHIAPLVDETSTTTTGKLHPGFSIKVMDIAAIL
jgi:hypothetical protein